MPDIKNYDAKDKGLKHADSDKSGGVSVQSLGSLPKTKKAGYDMVKKVRSARKRMPIVVDVIIAILLAAVICAVAYGSFYAFRYFTVDYDTVEVEYSILPDVPITGNVKNQQVYFEFDGNTVHFGKIKSVETNSHGQQIVVIAHTVKYKADEGYSIGDEKIAVGCVYSFRTEKEITVSGTVVELVDKTVSDGEKGGK